MKDESLSDHRANDKSLNLSSDSNNVSIETDLRVFKGAIKGKKSNEPTQNIVNLRPEITNINININNGQLMSHLTSSKGGNLTKLIIPNFQDLQNQIGLNMNNNINTFSSRQPADVSFREAIKLMYKKIEVNNEQKFQGKGGVDAIKLQEPQNSSKLKDKTSPEAENISESKSTSKKKLKIPQHDISKAIIQESPLHKICAPISYQELEETVKKSSTRAKCKLNTKSLPKHFLQTLKHSLMPPKEKQSSKIANKPISQIECVLSTKTKTKTIFVTNKEFILSLDNILLKNNLDDYIGNDFIIHIHHLNPHKELFKNVSTFQKKFSRQPSLSPNSKAKSTFNPEISTTSNFILYKKLKLLLIPQSQKKRLPAPK